MSGLKDLKMSCMVRPEYTLLCHKLNLYTTLKMNIH